MKLSKKEKERIINILRKRKLLSKCPMCANRSFTIADGYFKHSIDAKLKGFVLGGPSIPSIGLVCNNCGFISQHALGVLGLLSKNKSNSKTQLKDKNQKDNTGKA